MTALIAITYSSTEAARDVEARLRAHEIINGNAIKDLVVAERDKQGKVVLHQSESQTAEGAIGGSFIGLLVGIIFAAPVFGFLGGAAIGAAGALLDDHGIPDPWMKELADQVAGGRATLFVLLAETPNDKAMEIFGHDGEVLYTSLSYDDEAQLRRSMADTLGVV